MSTARWREIRQGPDLPKTQWNLVGFVGDPEGVVGIPPARVGNIVPAGSMTGTQQGELSVNMAEAF